MNDTIKQLLSQCAIFKPLTEEGCEFLLSKIELISLNRNDFLFRHGEEADALYIIIEGRMLLITDAKHSQFETCRKLAPGSLVGEVGILTGRKRALSAQALNDVKLIKLSKADYRSYHKRFSKLDNFMVLLKNSRLFKALKDEDLPVILSKFEKIKLIKNDILFEQGDAPDGLYVLITGRLIAQLTTNVGAEIVVGTVERGETVGELGALSGEARTLTVRALCESHLLKISKEAFKEYCMRHPEIMFEVLNTMVKRSQNTISLLSDKKGRKHVAILPANQRMPWQQFSTELKQYTKNKPNITVLDDTENLSRQEITAIISELQYKNHIIIYFISNPHSALTQICYEHVEGLFIVAKDGEEQSFDGIAAEFLRKELPVHVRKELILLHDESKKIITGTKHWLQKASFNLHHHLCWNNDKDYQRLLRLLLDQAIGLVLGGGGAKAWAEIGVIKALAEADLPIDAIGGTSAGAVVGACYLLHRNLDGARMDVDKIVKTIYPVFSLANLTWPIVSVLSAKKGTEVLINIFKDTQIEDLWLPYFCVSCNLNQKTELVQREGYLWEKLRSTVSIPGVAPPVVKNGQLYVDGGLINNVPVDVMRDLLGKNSLIVAVNLSELEGDSTMYNIPLVLTFKEALLYKLGFRRKYKFPRFFCLAV